MQELNLQGEIIIFKLFPKSQSSLSTHVLIPDVRILPYSLLQPLNLGLFHQREGEPVHVAVGRVQRRVGRARRTRRSCGQGTLQRVQIALQRFDTWPHRVFAEQLKLAGHLLEVENTLLQLQDLVNCGRKRNLSVENFKLYKLLLLLKSRFYFCIIRLFRCLLVPFASRIFSSIFL